MPKKTDPTVETQHRQLQQALFEREEHDRLKRKQERELQEIIDEPELTRWLIYYEGEAAFWTWYETVRDHPERMSLMRDRLAKLRHAQRIANEKAKGEKVDQAEANGKESGWLSAEEEGSHDEGKGVAVPGGGSQRP